MTRTKKPRQKSTIKKEFSRSDFSSVSSDCGNSLIKQCDDLSSLLSRTYETTDHFKKEFELFYEAKLKARHKQYELACELVNTAFKDVINSLPETYLNSKIHSCFDEDLLKIGIKDLNTEGPGARPSRARQETVKKLDSASFEFKRPKTPRVNRSSSRKRSVSVPPPNSFTTPSSDRFKTPSRSLQTLGPLSVITPKVANTPMCIMRRPERGEVAFAASGSPLLVGRVSIEDIPTVTVPLQDGRIFSILPDPEGGPPILPEFDEETKKYLKTLRQHLDLLALNSP